MSSTEAKEETLVELWINDRMYMVPAEMPVMLNYIIQERLRQEAKWGEQNHDPATWNLIITEELGEAAQEALNLLFKGMSDIVAEKYHTELTQVAASALAAMECALRTYLKTSQRNEGAQ